MGTAGPRVRVCDRTALAAGKSVAVATSHGDAVEVVSCGTPLGGQELVIVSADGCAVAHDEIGEIWLRGPSVARGYWGNAAATREVFGGYLPDGRGPYLRTGDLGWMSAAGEVFITGRKKDLIVVRGQNYYPTDIESTVETAVPGVRPGCVAAISLEDDLGESVAIVCEPAASNPSVSCADAMVQAIRSAVSETFGLRLSAVALVDRGALPKTASGKLQRGTARADLIDGTLAATHLWQARGEAYTSSSDAASCDADLRH
jgi:acyl-CoA synthetase (AMP-forming)/AMP-acid ligase II